MGSVDIETRPIEAIGTVRTPCEGQALRYAIVSRNRIKESFTDLGQRTGDWVEVICELDPLIVGLGQHKQTVADIEHELVDLCIQIALLGDDAVGIYQTDNLVKGVVVEVIQAADNHSLILSVKCARLDIGIHNRDQV